MMSSSILVGNRSYDIVSLNDEEFDQILFKKDAYDPQVKSFVDYDDQLICVRERLKPDHKQELVLHELLHACADDAGIDQDEKFESFVRSFSPRLSSLLSCGLQNVISKI